MFVSRSALFSFEYQISSALPPTLSNRVTRSLLWQCVALYTELGDAFTQRQRQRQRQHSYTNLDAQHAQMEYETMPPASEFDSPPQAGAGSPPLAAPRSQRVLPPH